MWKFLKTMVAEDVTITEEVRVVVLVEEVLEALEAKEVRHQEKVVLEALLQEKAALKATEIQHQEKVVFLEVQRHEEKADLHQDHRMHQEEKVVLHQDRLMRQNVKEVLQVELQDVLKVLVTHQDQEDQEKNNNIC